MPSPTVVTLSASLSTLFFSRLTFHSEESSLDLAALIGKSYDLAITLPEGTKQPINAHVDRAIMGKTTVRSTAYTLELRPWLYFLKQGSACRVFQGKTVPEIIKSVAGEAGYTAIKESLNNAYAKLEYVVQYNESDFNFLSRLMEDVGIFYSFTHAKGAHTLVLADSIQGYQAGPELKWIGENYPETPDACVWNVGLEHAAQPTMAQVDDYNYLTPTANLTAKSGSGYPIETEFNTGHLTQALGEGIATHRLDGFETFPQELTGQSAHSALAVGMTVTIKDCPLAAINKKWLITALEGHFEEEVGRCLINFRAIPADKSFKPPRRHMRPRISGPLTGVVCGKSGEEIWTDEHGRIKVRFHFDHKTPADEKASIWLRVAQSWAGKNHGAFFLPRVGDEVLIDFLGGDPDRPIVTASLYNATAKPPWALTDNKTISGIKGFSSPEGEAGNEINFDDKKDAERLYFHAQKLLEILVEEERKVTVLGETGDSLTLEKSSRSVLIKKGDTSLTIDEGNQTSLLKKGNISLSLDEGNQTSLLKKGDTSLSIDEGNRLVELKKGNDTLSVKGDRTIEIEKDEKHSVKKNLDLVIDGDYTITIKGALTLKAKNITLEADQAMEAKSGQGLELVAGTALKAKSGTDAEIKAGTGLTLAGGTTFKLSASAKGEVNGGGMLDVKGGLVKLN